jgi:hypothetical protein
LPSGTAASLSDSDSTLERCDKLGRKSLPAALQSQKLLQSRLSLMLMRFPLAQTRELKSLGSQHPLCKRFRKLLPAMLHRLQFHLQSYPSLMRRRVLPGPIRRRQGVGRLGDPEHTTGCPSLGWYLCWIASKHSPLHLKSQFHVN